MNREAFKPGAILDKIKGETPKTRKGRVMKRVLSTGLALGVVLYADFVQTGARGLFDNHDISDMVLEGVSPFGESFKTCNLQEDVSQTDIIKNRIKQKFGVDTLNPDKMPSLDTYPENGERVDVNTVEWDAKSLSSLYKVLCAIPQHMYLTRTGEEKQYEINFATNPQIRDYFNNGLPNNTNEFKFTFPNNSTVTLSRETVQQGIDLLKKGQNQTYSETNIYNVNMQLVLVEDAFKEGSVLAGGEYKHADVHSRKNDVVALVRKPENEDYYYLQLIVHELTHRIHAVKEKDMDTELFKILEVKDQMEFKEAKFVNKNTINSIIVSLERVRDTIGREKSLTLGIFSAITLIPTHLEYGKTNSNEFTSVGAEYYIYGRQAFLTIYSQFMGREKAVEFYDLLKKNIFEDREY